MDEKILDELRIMKRLLAMLILELRTRKNDDHLLTDVDNAMLKLSEANELLSKISETIPQ